MIEPRSAYDLEGCCTGRTLFLVGPGPSAANFPLRALGDRPALAINSALELLTPRWWMYADKRFTRYYGRELHRKKNLQAIMPYHQVCKVQRYFAGAGLWFYHYQMKLKRWTEGTWPFWYSRERAFLPGRASVLNNAISLAWLMQPAKVVLVGIDFDFGGEEYYAAGIKKNPGPRPDQRRNALLSGFRWFAGGLRRRGSTCLWPALDLSTTSATLHARLPKVPLIAPMEALNGA